MNKIDEVRVKAGRIIRVENTKKKTNTAKIYLSVWIEDADGKNERCLLFTEREIRNAVARAEKNLEDLTNKGLITDILD